MANQNKDEKLQYDRTRIHSAFDSYEELRDIFDERRNTLTRDEAKVLTEVVFSNELFEIEEDVKEEIFDFAFSATYEHEINVKNVNWIAVFNEYKTIVKVIQAVRESKDETPNYEESGYYAEVVNSSNKISTAASIFRTNKDVGEDAGRKIIEACYPNILNTLDLDARREIFEYSYSRYSEEGWGAVSSSYSEIMDIVGLVKVAPHLREEIKEFRESNEAERRLRNSRFTSD